MSKAWPNSRPPKKNSPRYHSISHKVARILRLLAAFDAALAIAQSPKEERLLETHAMK